MTENEQNATTSNNEYKKWIGVGIAIGAGLGIIFDNIAIGVALGLVFGITIGRLRSQRKG